MKMSMTKFHSLFAFTFILLVPSWGFSMPSTCLHKAYQTQLMSMGEDNFWEQQQKLVSDMKASSERSIKA
jgi:hypothetical protein